jgi:anaerobic selenocysteine-containing dehydrogenase
LGISKEEVEKQLIPPGEEGVQQYLNEKLAQFPNLSYEKLKEGPMLAPNLQEIAFSDMVFATPSGKIELFAQQATELWGANQLPTYEPLAEGNLKTEVETKYPLFLMSPNTKNRIHSQFNNLKVIKMLNPEPFVEINPYDARIRNIRNGSKTKVFNGRGEVVVKAKLTYSVRVGCVVIHNGWWATEGCSVNNLSKGRETDMGHGTAFHDNRVEVERG